MSKIRIRDPRSGQEFVADASTEETWRGKGWEVEALADEPNHLRDIIDPGTGMPDIAKMQAIMEGINKRMEAPAAMAQARASRQSFDRSLLSSRDASWWRVLAVKATRRSDDGNWAAAPGAEIGRCVLPFRTEAENAVVALMNYGMVDRMADLAELEATTSRRGLAIIRREGGEPVYLLHQVDDGGVGPGFA